MDKILENLGIYDLIAVLLPGICICVFSLAILQFDNTIPRAIYTEIVKAQSDESQSEEVKSTETLIDKIQINETLSFFVASYFLGLIFQESGSLIQRKILNRNNNIFQKVIHFPKNDSISLEDSRMHLTGQEWDDIKSHVESKLRSRAENDKENYAENLIWNYCKLRIREKYDTTRMDKYQSLSAMSRSLFLYGRSTKSRNSKAKTVKV